MGVGFRRKRTQNHLVSARVATEETDGGAGADAAERRDDALAAMQLGILEKRGASISTDGCGKRARTRQKGLTVMIGWNCRRG
jgi:hypothetical protein